MADAMKEWCREHQCSYSEIVRVARERNLLIPVSTDGLLGRFTLTKGTQLSTVQGMCYLIDEGRLFHEDEVAAPANVVPLRKESRNESSNGQAASEDSAVGA